MPNSTSSCYREDNSQITRLNFKGSCDKLWRQKKQNIFIMLVWVECKTWILHIFSTWMKKKKICVSSAVQEEMIRLRQKCRTKLSIPNVEQLGISRSITICFQNCRSLQKHIEDIRKDIYHQGWYIGIVWNTSFTKQTIIQFRYVQFLLCF